MSGNPIRHRENRAATEADTATARYGLVCHATAGALLPNNDGRTYGSHVTECPIQADPEEGAAASGETMMTPVPLAMPSPDTEPSLLHGNRMPADGHGLQKVIVLSLLKISQVYFVPTNPLIPQPFPRKLKRSVWALSFQFHTS